MKQHARLASSAPKAASLKVTASSAFDAGTEVKPKADEVSARDRGETSGGGGEDPTGRLSGEVGEDPTRRSSGGGGGDRAERRRQRGIFFQERIELGEKDRANSIGK